jgi:nucleoside-diphosphate-sugar epimerase
MRMTNRCLIVGCGDLGNALALDLCEKSWQVTGLSRTQKTTSNPHFTRIAGDVTQPETLLSLTKFYPEILVYCVAADAQTDAAYQAQYVNGLKNILATQMNNPQLRAVFFVSSTRVYGQVTNELLDENTAPIASDFGGERLLEAEALLKSFALPSKTCQKIALRLSGIYGPGRTRMLRLAQAHDAWPAQNAWSNRIHRDDAAAFIAYLIQKVMDNQVLQPCYVVTDSQPSAQWEVLTWLAAQMLLPAKNENVVPPISGGKRLSNATMLATGFQLQYPDYKIGYASLLK